ncbi:MAG: radical SAM protein [Desulfobulbaceae bacterium]|nr:radical SAM protein [Desulfobulbaceae bacterium]
MILKTNQDPLIFDIARGSFVDGPGVRTTVFFKGCPLTCPWCHNPEAQGYATETMFFPENCIGCNNCKKGKECFTLARRTIGKNYSPNQLVEIILEDKAYYESSGGGVTFSGGEALSFINYLSQVIPALKKEKIHIAVQTCGYFNFDSFKRKIFPSIDLIYYDFKIMDKERHKQVLGKSNRTILNNFKHLLEYDIPVIPRIPLIPHFVATKHNLNALAQFFSVHKVKNCEFLYYNPGALEKLARLNRKPDPRLPDKPVSTSENQAWIDYFTQQFTAYEKYGRTILGFNK